MGSLSEPQLKSTQQIILTSFRRLALGSCSNLLCLFILAAAEWKLGKICQSSAWKPTKAARKTLLGSKGKCCERNGGRQQIEQSGDLPPGCVESRPPSNELRGLHARKGTSSHIKTVQCSEAADATNRSTSCTLVYHPKFQVNNLATEARGQASGRAQRPQDHSWWSSSTSRHIWDASIIHGAGEEEHQCLELQWELEAWRVGCATGTCYLWVMEGERGFMVTEDVYLHTLLDRLVRADTHKHVVPEWEWLKGPSCKVPLKCLQCNGTLRGSSSSQYFRQRKINIYSLPKK